MRADQSSCSACERTFKVQFRYQVREERGRFVYFCSQACLQASLQKPVCSACGSRFELEYPYQCQVGDGEPVYFCTPQCREAARAGVYRTGKAGGRAADGPRRIAVFNHKGGTGKTTTAVNLAAGLADRGMRVLLVDADGQGNVGASLGISGERTLYHVLVHTLAVLPRPRLPTQHGTLVQAKGHDNGLHRTAAGQQCHNNDHQVLGGPQPIERGAPGLGKCLATYVALVPTFLQTVHADVSFVDLSTCRTSRIGAKYRLWVHLAPPD